MTQISMEGQRCSCPQADAITVSAKNMTDFIFRKEGKGPKPLEALTISSFAPKNSQNSFFIVWHQYDNSCHPRSLGLLLWGGHARILLSINDAWACDAPACEPDDLLCFTGHAAVRSLQPMSAPFLTHRCIRHRCRWRIADEDNTALTIGGASTRALSAATLIDAPAHLYERRTAKGVALAG